MKRPNRYPYTRSQWEKEITLVYFCDDGHLEIKAKRNRITNEVKNEKINSCFLT